MSIRPPIPGSRLYEQPNRNDVENKLTYQMLLQENKNFRTEIDSLKDINSRMGRELDRLHSHFQIKDSLDTNLSTNERGLYAAMQSEPALFRYLPFLNPLFEAYDYKIGKFEEAYDRASSKFITIERKYDELLEENSRLKQKLQEKTQQLLEYYRSKAPEKTHQLFKDIVQDQLNERQEILLKENAQVASKFRELEGKTKQLTEELKSKTEKHQTDSKALRDLEREFKSQSLELTNLRKSFNELQIQNRQLESSQSQVQKAYDRSTIQIKSLNDEISKLEAALKQLRDDTETRVPDSKRTGDNKKQESMEKQLSYLRAQLKASEGSKQMENARKEIDSLTRTANQAKENLEAATSREKLLQGKLAELKDKNNRLESDNSILKSKEAQLSKSLASITEKNKGDNTELARGYEEKLRGLEADMQAQIDQKDEKIRSLSEQLERTRADKERVDRELKLVSQEDDRGLKSRDLARQVEKLSEKLKNTEDIHKQTMELIYAQNEQLKTEVREIGTVRPDLDRRVEELRRLRVEYEKLKGENESMGKQKHHIIEEMKKIRSSYEVALREKESAFDQKVREIRALLEEAVSKQKSSRQEIAEIARSYKKKVDDIKNIYEERIRQLQGQVDMLKKRYLDVPQTTTQQHVVTVTKKVM